MDGETQVISTDMETQAYTNNSDEPTLAIPELDSDETQVNVWYT